MRVALDTLGCKLNQAETELLAREFVDAGHELVSRVDEADAYILNTCTVTHTADSKSRHLLRRAHRRNPGAMIVAAGCYAQRARWELAPIDGVTLVVGNNEKARLPQLLEELNDTDNLTSPRREARGHQSLARRTRFCIKIQDGCNSSCSYCIVPLVRGSETSLPVEQVVAEVGRRAVDGYKEVVPPGTNMGAYDCEGISLTGLLERILAGTGIVRVRLSSLQPHEISPGLVGLWTDGRLCPHFHLSLQSGSDRVLKRMRRRYHAADYEQAVSLVRENVPDVAITTDVIVGFPGETDDEFEESYDFCRRMEFARIHVFPYSLRSGTEAAGLPGTVDNRTKKQRSDRMLALAEESAQNFRQRFSGRTRTVLWEQRTANGIWSVTTDNYLKVYTESEEELGNRVMAVKVR